MSDKTLIELDHVTKRYTKGRDTIEIFDELTMGIEEGSFLAIMGPSGSGKTTLLNILGGIDKPTSGAVTVGGQRIDNMSEGDLSKWRASNVGFIFQFYNLMPMLSAAQNVELPLLLTNLGRSKRAEHVKTALDVVGIGDRAKHKPSELSGGQQQRVAIARAIVSDPKLMLADEPTGDLDRTTAVEILEMLQLLNKEFGKTIIMVTHDPEAARYATQILHLDKGHFVQEAAE